MPHKILILSCNTGEGHNSAAKALKRTIENDGMQCDIYDALGLAGKRLSNKVSRIYDNSVKNSLFSTGYAIGEWYSSIRFKPRSPVYRFNKTYATEIYHLICGNGYDAVVCTHPFPALSVSFIKEKYGLCIPSFFVATDYTCYPFMNETDLDGYMIAHSDLIEEYVRKGVPAEKIYPTGIPCRADNLVGKIPQKEARQELDEIYSLCSQSLDGRWFLIMGGSMGFGNMNELIGHLLNKCSPKDRIVCICGRNQEQEREIQGRYPESSIVKVVGYTDRVMLFMDACDVLAYKAAQQNMEYDISSSSWSGDYLDPATFVELWRSGGGNNCTGWGSTECDSALAAARATGSADERRAHLQQAEECMLRELPILPLYHSERTYLRSNRHVSGWQPRLLDNFPLDAVEVKP